MRAPFADAKGNESRLTALVATGLCALLGCGAESAPPATASAASAAPAALIAGTPRSADAARGLDPEPAFTFAGPQPGAAFGWAVAGSGDVNGDGFADLAMGAPSVGSADSPGGFVAVYYGGPGGPSPTPDWTAAGQPWDVLGTSVAFAGDVNGDGYGDLVVGAPGFGDTAGPERGRASLFLGSAAGLAATPAWTHEGTAGGSRLGQRVAAAGDVNGDGYADVLVAVPGDGAGGPALGAVRLFFGAPAGLGATPAWQATAVEAGDGFGAAIAGAGDVDSDGYADILVGAPAACVEAACAGAAFLYRGGPAGPGASPDWAAHGLGNGETFGFALAAAGDANGDGYADVLVAAPMASHSAEAEGRVDLFLGSPAGLSDTAAWSDRCGVPYAQIGTAVAGMGDVNADGLSDLVIGAPYAPVEVLGAGLIRVFYGAPGGPAATPDVEIGDVLQFREFGFALAPAGDVDGDGYADVLAGSPDVSPGRTNEGSERVNEGLAYVFRGAPEGVGATPAWTGSPGQPLARFGTALVAAGDIEGDGFADVLVAAPSYDGTESDQGRAYLFSGGADGLPAEPGWTFDGGEAGAFLGEAVAGAEDINGDGFADVVVGAPYCDEGALDSGAVLVFLGSRTGLPTSPSQESHFNISGARFGAALAGVGDVNGDGHADVLVGVPGWNSTIAGVGAAFLYLGVVGGLEPAPGWHADGTEADEAFGAALAAAGDVNGDGFADVVVAAPLHDGLGDDRGRVALYLGGAAGLAATPAWTAVGDQDGARFGAAVGRAGDVDGDGFGDVLVGAPDYAGAFAGGGRAYLFRGTATGLEATPAWQLDGTQAGAALGSAVAAAGDATGDGIDDLLVSAPGITNGQSAEGRIFLFAGGPAGPAAEPTWQAESDLAGARLGAALAAAGDIDGDGFPDVLAGAPNASGGPPFQGLAFAYLGNAGRGPTLQPLQTTADGSRPVAPGGLVDAPTGIRVGLLAPAAGPAGRLPVRLVYELKPHGVPFDGRALAAGPVTADPWPQGGYVFWAPLSEAFAGTAFHWRARLSWADGSASPWVRFDRTGRALPDFRTAGDAALGTPCAGPDGCASGFCTDGVCCEAASCADAFDCTADRCAPTGHCASTPYPAGTVCRPAGSRCDPAETCRGVVEDCPADVVYPHSGDVNDNGTFTAGDAQLGFTIALGVGSYTDPQWCAADCNGNGAVTAGDAQLIFAYVLGAGPACVDGPAPAAALAP